MILENKKETKSKIRKIIIKTYLKKKRVNYSFNVYQTE